MTTSSSNSLVELILPGDTTHEGPDNPEADVLAMFDRAAPSLLRYARSFGFTTEEAEDIVQETFLALFRHLRLGRDRRNLHGWVFRVVHNLALRHHRQARRRPTLAAWDDATIGARIDPAPNPEARLVEDERRRRLVAVVRVLPARERRCLLLRAEGLTYRDIAAAARLSLGGVAKVIARAMTRLVHADGG